MLKFLAVIIVLFALALGFHALSNQPGEVTLTLGDTVYGVSLTTAVIGAIVIVLIAMGLLWFVRAILAAPWRIASGWRQRNRERGREAVSQGLVAIAAGDVRAAERATYEALRRAPHQPLTLLLQAQTAQLRGDREAAREIFKDMVEEPATRIAGLRGLYVEAEREGAGEAAYQIAERARREAPAAPWAARALMRHQTSAADWEAALATLASASDARILDKRTARRQRAVILTAKALAKENGEPDAARASAMEAHDLAADLVPAAVVAGRLLARQGDIRRATRILEASWKASPHPEIADAYMHVRAGDSATDRLKRAEVLFRLRPLADEGRHAVTRGAIDARDFKRAREVLAPILTGRPTRRALMLMAELEEAETGDRGRAREWAARAVYAQRDPAWTSEGVVLEEWAPVSPGGKLDAVEWKVPVTEIAGPRVEIDKSELSVVSPAGAPLAAVLQQGAASIEQPVPPATQTNSPGAPPRVSLIATIARGELPKPVSTVEPPRPDDPGVDADEQPEGRRSKAL